MQGVLREKVLRQIAQFPVTQEDAAILLAVSGGADSVAMAHILHGLAEEGKLSCGFVIAHINHCLRGAESDADEVFVEQLGQSLDLPVISQRVDVQAYAKSHKLSIETAGRVLRLQTLAQMAEQNGCGCIATAHHKDDLAETMVHRLMRGTGFRGLCGIWAKSEIDSSEFIRPMLGVRRDEIIRYCKDHSIRWRQDVSNRDTRFTRNRIRHRLLPALKDSVVGMAHPTGLTESGDIVDKLERLSLASQRFQSATERIAQTVIAEGEFDRGTGQFIIEQDILKDTTAWAFYEVVREVLVKLGVGLRQYKREHFDKIRALLGEKRGGLTLPKGLCVEAADERLVFSRSLREQRGGHGPPYGAVQLEIGGIIRFGPWRISSRILESSKADFEEFRKTKNPGVEWFDAERINGPVEIRGRRNGDRFWPIGASGEKKIGRFLIDAQLEAGAKQQAVVVKDTEKIIWVSPVRMCEQAKITRKTSQILEICIDRA
ncbi:MAG: tRNA lysidine(34) synthetase TilS [Planctomycetales bacterium 4572_13]|nr:MAG: tRNA lysidine(34) synthetase TilS [Planctomycetales bacterium 4572_13]